MKKEKHTDDEENEHEEVEEEQGNEEAEHQEEEKSGHNEEEEEEGRRDVVHMAKVKEEKKTKKGTFEMFEFVAFLPGPKFPRTRENQFWIGQVQKTTPRDKPISIRWAREEEVNLPKKERKRLGEGGRVYCVEMVEEDSVSPRQIVTRGIQLRPWFQQKGDRHECLFLLPEEELQRILASL